MQIQTILVPVDFSKHSEKALEIAASFAEGFGARIVLLHAYHRAVPGGEAGIGGGVRLPADFYDRLSSATLDSLEKVAKPLQARGIDVTNQVVSEPASLAILQEAEKLPADLIVMGSRGRTGLSHVMFGSVAERVVRTAQCPVLTVKD